MYRLIPCKKLVLAVVLAGSMTLWGCTAPPPPSGEVFLQNLMQMLEDTADAVADDLDYQGAEPATSPTVCRPWWAVNTGRVWSYEITIQFSDSTDTNALVQETFEYWKAEGYEVQAQNMNTNPALFVSFEDYVMELRVDEEQQMAYLTGNTPCLPVTPPEET